MIDIIQLIGYVGGIVIAISLTPQVIKAYKTKSTKDISLLWNIVFIAGLTLFFIYGVGIKEIPIIVAGIIEISLAVSLIIAKLKYG